MEEYKPNSHRSREGLAAEASPEKKVEKIISGSVRSKKKGEIRKIADIFVAEDIQNVKSYIFMEVLVPAIKKALSDIVINGMDMILYGEAGKNRKNGSASKVSYRSYFNDGGRRESTVNRARNAYDYDDIVFENRGEAEQVLSAMDDIIETYGVVSVGDYYELCGVDGNSTGQKYGWKDIRSAQVMRVRDGYMIKLPRALPIN